MATVTVSKVIAAPLHRVFESFTDVEHGQPEVSGIKKIEMETPDHFGLGTKWIETRKVYGVTDSAEMEVTSFERDRTYTITHYKGGLRIDTVFSFESVTRDSTKVTVEYEIESDGLPPGFLAPLNWVIADMVREVLGHDLRDMKSAIEHT